MSISNGESGSSVRTKINASLALTDAITSSAAELNILDGATLNTNELNQLDDNTFDSTINVPSLTVSGTNGNGHAHIRWQATDPSGQGNHTTVFADADGDLSIKIDGGSTKVLATTDDVALKQSISEKGSANGYAPLDSGAKISSTYLPSYVDDVVEADNYAALPATGETGKIYVTIDTGYQYRWSGSVYVEIKDSGETAQTAGALINSATAKTTPVDGDFVGLMDSAASNILKKLSWANIKATLKTYYDTLYQAVLISGTNIKTINSTSILGSGDLTVTATSLETSTWTNTDALGTQTNNYSSGISTSKNIMSVIRCNFSNMNILTGIVATSMEDGKRVRLVNVTDPLAASGVPILIENLSPDSTSGNRIFFPPTGCPAMIMPGEYLDIAYSMTNTRWEYRGSSRGINPSSFFDYFNDMYSAATMANNTTGASASCATGNSYITSTTVKPCGTVDLATGTTSTGAASINMRTDAIKGGNGGYLVIYRVGVPTALSTNGVEEYISQAGITDGTTSATVDGCFWEYDVDNASGTVWNTVTMSNTSNVEKNGQGPTVSIGEMPFLGVWCNYDWTKIVFFYSTDGTNWVVCSTAHTNATNIPTGSTRATSLSARIIKSAGTTSRVMAVDYVGAIFLVNRGV